MGKWLALFRSACGCAQPPRIGMSQRSMDRTVSSSFFFLKKEPVVLSELIDSGPCFPAVTVKACALIGAHMTAEENALRSDSDLSPGSGDMWKYGLCGAATSGRELRMLRLSSIRSTTSTISLWKPFGQNWSSEVISLFLEDCCQWTFLCQEVRGACKGSSESLGSPRSLCSECLEERRRCSDAKVPSYNGRPGV